MPARKFGGDFSEKDFFPLPVFERKIVGFLAKFFRQVCQVCILLLHRHCLRIFPFSKPCFLNIFIYRAKNIWTFDKIFSGRSIKLHSNKSSEQFAVNQKFPKLFYFLYHIWLFSGTFYAFWRMYSVWSSKKIIRVQGAFCRKTCLCAKKNLFLYHFWILKEIFRIFILNNFPKSYQYCFLGVRKKVFTKVFPLKSIKFPFSISQKCGKSSISSEIFLKGLPQLLSPDEHFQWFFFPDEGQILSHLRTLNKKSGFVADFFSAGL